MGRALLADLFLDLILLKTTDDLWACFEQYCKKQGFRYSRLSVFSSKDDVKPHNLQMLLSFDETGWANHYVSKGMYRYDQSFHLIKKGLNESLSWSKMNRMTRKGSLANSVFTEAIVFGLEEGMLVSNLCDQHGLKAFLGIAGPKVAFKKFTRTELRTLSWCGHVLIGRIFVSSIKEGRIKPKLIQVGAELTDRQREVLILKASGSTSAAAAKLLNIKRDSVDKMIHRLKNRFGVQSDTALVAECLRRGLIS